MNNEIELTAALLTIEKSKEESGCPAGVALQDWVKQLAAENMQVRERHRFIRALAVSILEHSGGRHDWRGAMEDVSDLVKAVDEVYAQSRLTDRSITVFKADAIDEAAVELERIDTVASTRAIAFKLREFSKQLREGADK